MKIARMAPFSSPASKENMQIATPQGDGASNTNRQIGTPRQRENRSIFEKLQSLIGETLDFMVKEEEKKGVFVTKEDLVGWAEQLDKDGKHEYALEIFEWMDKNKMIFSPSELALFVDLLVKTKGLDAAEDYFEKVDPDFDENDLDAKNWPAYARLLHWLNECDKKSMAKPAVRRKSVLVSD